MSTAHQRSPEETRALAEQNGKLIERISKLVAERAKAQADLEVVRRIIAASVIDADQRDSNGEPCWCLGIDLMKHATGEASHEPSCNRLRTLIRKLVAAVEVEP